MVANIYNSSVDDTHCGQGLSMVPTYWILEGPRIFVIVVSLGMDYFYKNLALILLRGLWFGPPFFESLEKRWNFNILMVTGFAGFLTET